MSEMEPEIKDFLAKIATTVSAALLWLLLNSTLGIGLDWAFFSGSPTIINYVFYLWLIISFIFLAKFLIKKWR